MASNAGSVATILGNPQNALIGIRSGISFVQFTSGLWSVAAVAVVITAAVVAWIYRREVTSAPIRIPPPREPQRIERWMLAAGLASGVGMVVALMSGVRPAAAAMGAAAVVMIAGSSRPRRALREVDWMLLLLFAGLFVVMRGVEKAGISEALVTGVAGSLDTADGGALARLGLAVSLLSQAVSNVPAVILFVPALESLAAEAAGTLWLALAAFSTLAGNLTIIGSVANVIVFETARREGVEVGFFEFFRAGLPVTLLTLVAAWALLALR
jgi:Na+/H+ antiporter NhaD/arsenite permease-like protein